MTGLSSNGALSELDLSGNPLGDDGVSMLAVHVIEGGMGGPLPTLQILRLSRTNTGEAGLCALLDSLQVNTSIQQLDLSANWIGAVEISRYSRFQVSNKSLKLLDLRDNNLSPLWCQELMSAASVGMRRLVLL